MTEAISVSEVLSASPDAIYDAWISGDGHSKMTGANATVDARVGGAFTAWDGYINGTTLELEPNKRIVQAWRTSEFPDDAEDSRIEILLKPVASGTTITLHHTNIPDGQGMIYKEGWKEHYFEPMSVYFKSGDAV